MFRAATFVLPLFTLVCGCVTYPRVTPDRETVALVQARFEIPEPLLLDVRIQVFDPGELPFSQNASRGLSQKIREAESPYAAAQLKHTMQQTNHWGAVRVVPAEHWGDEVLVDGRILKSNGEELRLNVGVLDATGRQWFRKTFHSAVSEEQCRESSEKQVEVFQNIYNKIANELAAHYGAFTVGEIQEIRCVAEMRFAEALVPRAFTGYLRKEKVGFFSKHNIIKLDRLPSEDDEMMNRVRRVRVRNNMLVDTLDAHYDGLHAEMKDRYTDWRISRIVEMNMIREADDKRNKEIAKGMALVVAGAAAGAATSQLGPNYSASTGAIVGSALGLGTGIILNAGKIAEEAAINKAALEDLGFSFGIEVEPITLEVEGKTIKLTGSAEAMYSQWRDVLTTLYNVDTAAQILPEDPSP